MCCQYNMLNFWCLLTSIITYNSSFRTSIRTIQKPLKLDTKEFENRLKIAILKNATLELGEDIGNQIKNRS